MYQKLFENWRNFKALNEYEVEKSESEMYGKSFRDFLDNLPTDQEISQFESEMSSEVQEKKAELEPEAQAQPIDKVSSPQAAKRYADKIWIFFDTETTNLEVGPNDQITQIAALAMDPKGFREGVDAQEVGRFNKKLNLAQGTLDALAYEKEDTEDRERRNREKIRRRRESYRKISPGISVGKPLTPYELERARLDNLAMTKLGIKRSEEKRKKKEYPQYVEIEKAAGRTPLSFEDYKPTPGPKEMIKYGPDVMKDFLDFIDQYPNRILVAQNAGFDVKQVNYLLQRVGLPVPQEKVFDTITFFRKYLVPIMKSLHAKRAAGEELSPADIRFLKDLTKNGKQTVSLGFLVKAFKLENKGWHDAFADVQMLHDVMKACIVFLQSRSEFADLLAQQPAKKPRSYSRSSSDQQVAGVKPSDID